MINSVYNELPNDALTKLIDRNLRRLGGIKYNAEEKSFAEALRRTISLDSALPLGSEEQIQAPTEGVR